MATARSRESSAEPNLTPILDMVFQLITFFMLVINFQGAALDTSLSLPVLGSARPLDTQGQEGLLVLNIDAEGRLKVYGRVEEVERYIAREAQLEALKISTRKSKFRVGDELPTMVVVRADRATPFRLLNEIVKVCQKYGYRKFSLKAMNRPQES